MSRCVRAFRYTIFSNNYISPLIITKCKYFLKINKKIYVFKIFVCFIYALRILIYNLMEGILSFGIGYGIGRGPIPSDEHVGDKNRWRDRGPPEDGKTLVADWLLRLAAYSAY